MFAVENKQQISNFCVYLELCLFIHRLGRINYAFNHSRESPDGVTTQDHISSSSTNEDENLSEEVDEFGDVIKKRTSRASSKRSSSKSRTRQSTDEDDEESWTTEF